MRKRTLWVFLIGVAIGVGIWMRWRPDVAPRVGTGFAAKVLCSLVFDSGLDPGSEAVREYLASELGPGGDLVHTEIDRRERAVDARALGLFGARAIHREGLGCTLVADADEAALRRWRPPPPSGAAEEPGRPWPGGAAGPAAPASEAVRAALDAAFAEPNPEAGGPHRHTLAVVVARGGHLVAERYAPGVDARTPLLSWSMAKSVVATLVAIAVREGRLSLDEPAPVPEWRAPGDPRGAITLDELLRMSSGLAFDETYGATNDVSRMLFTQADTGAFAARFPLAHPPDGFWSYSSGTSNVVARLLRDAFHRDLSGLVRWSREVLFDRIGMRSAVFEPDASGSFIGSSFFFASARDWARLGQLHLQDGIWNGERVLPEGWVAYVTTPTPRAAQGRYGAHWWLNAGDLADPTRRMWPRLPRDAYAARGHSG